MKKILLVLLLPTLLFSQGLNLEKYKIFLNQTKDIKSESLYQLHPPGLYLSEAGIAGSDNLYLDSVFIKMKITEQEKELLNKNGFMVTERAPYLSFYHALKDIWTKDLPIFITTDMILHTVHLSYDNILKDLEYSSLLNILKTTIDSLHRYLPKLKEKYTKSDLILTSVDDLDVYLTVARKLVYDVPDIKPIWSKNQNTVDEIISYIEGLTPVSYKLFSGTVKTIDFSQFKPRGHYTESYTLSKYFKAMIWLGRTEFYLIAPEPASSNPQTPEDIQRQIIDAVLLTETVNSTGMSDTLRSFDNILSSLIGESDNVQLKHINEIMDEAGFKSVLPLTDKKNVSLFQSILMGKPYCDQKILSQIIWSDPFNTTKIQPASSFLFMGQRFILDSYIWSSLVHDKVPSRMLPSVYDILFVLGNNGAGHLLKSEIDKFKYAPNLAALRYIIDSYDNSFWNNSYYNNWLNSIRQLNPLNDDERNKLPRFMRTAAWWQEKMNTQLASWAQLRHDNLLYTKQSYSGGGDTCSYPYAYLEPIPNFYKSIKNLAEKGKSSFKCDYMISYYFNKITEIMDTLSIIAQKEVDNIPLSNNETVFLKSAYKGEYYGYSILYTGWFFDLLYDTYGITPNYVIADVHTAPTDEQGNFAGLVKHVGVGKVNLLVVNIESSDNKTITYCGPVLSFYEHTTVDFKRLTDEEWAKMFENTNIVKPDFVNLYMADSNGARKNGNLVSLPLASSDVPETTTGSMSVFTFPNPFDTYTNIALNLNSQIYSNVKLFIYSLAGEQIKCIFSGDIQSGQYIFRWDGTDRNNKKVLNGTYLLKIEENGRIFSGKLILER